MNEALQTALAGTLDRAADAMQAGTEFLQAELPDVIRQLLLWKLTYSLALCLLSVLLFVIAVWSLRVYRKGRKIPRPADLDDEKRDIWLQTHAYYPHEETLLRDGNGKFKDEYHVGLIPCLQIASLFVAAWALNLDWLQIWLAPKVYLIEFAANLAK